MPELSKNDIKMTKGLAIVSMVMLHLFCRRGDNVYGTPLLWINDYTPFVYYLGYLSEICVPMYCLCSGYAHYRQGDIRGLNFKKCLNRIMKVLINYWIVLVLFSLVGILVKSPDIPISAEKFLLNASLLSKSYNGAWWFVATYVLLVFISKGLYYISKNTNSYLLFLIICIQLVFFQLFSDSLYNIFSNSVVSEIVMRQFVNLMGDVIFSYIVGMLIAKHNVITYVRSKKFSEILLILFLVTLSIVVCILHKAILIIYYAIVVFVIFNTLKKGKLTKKIFEFLGTHSTNIWLTHMFFYLTLFPGLVQNLKYPIPMFLGLFASCIIVSYIINYIYRFILNLKVIHKILG